MYLITQSKNSISSLELARQLDVWPDTASLMRHKLMSVMQEREAARKLDGRVEMDDAVYGGEKHEHDGGKRGRSGPNKVPFVVAVATSDQGHPQRLLLHVVNSHDGNAIEAMARQHLEPTARIVSDGLGCFRAAKRGAATDRPQWSPTASRDLGVEVSERLDRAATWDDLDATFAEHGLSLEAKGTGLVVGDAGSYSKFSALGLTASAKDFEARFGGPYLPRPSTPPVPRRLFTVDAVDIVRGLANYGLADTSDMRQAIDQATATRTTQLAAAPLSVRMKQELKQAMSTTSLTSTRRPQPRPAKQNAANAHPNQRGR